jgi:hypothetical protein
MHVAWSRIDQDTLTAKALPFFKERLKKISRELELHFGLEPVTNRREGPIKYAPTKAQEEQARRLGLDAHELRNTIRECWDRSDNGHSFQTALEHEGMTVAQGERRDFVVIDQRGGTHVLSKRTLDVTAARIRDRLSDVSREDLPTVEQTRDFLRDVSNDRKQEQPDIKARLKQELAEVDRLLYGPSLGDPKRELKEAQDLIDKAQRNQQTEKPKPIWDRDRDDRAWQDAVINAAIEKEKIAREFVEPKARETRAGGRQGAGSREKEWPIMPPTPEPIRTSPRHHFEDAARETVRPKKEAVNQRAEQRAERRGAAHPERAANAKTDPRTVTNGSFRRSVKVGKAGTRAIGKTLDAVGSAVESLFAPTLTPAQIREGERAAHRREAEAERTLDFAKYTTELSHQRQQQENEREAERQRQNARGGRER